MASISKSQQQRRSQLFAQLGSFWTDVFGEKEKVRQLLAVNEKTSLVNQFQSNLANLAGDHVTGRRVEQRSVTFTEDDIFETGMLFQNDPGWEYASVADAKSAYSHYRIRYWGMFLRDVVPESIQASGKSLQVGIDFFIHGEFIYFRDDPRSLFPGFQYLVRVGKERYYQSYLNAFFRTNRPESDTYLQRYFRRAKSPNTFRLVLASLAGLKITGRDQYLLERHEQSDSGKTVYVFEHETIRIDYDHPRLTTDRFYPADTIIGDGIEFFQRSRPGVAWWRQVDWKGGVLLDPILQGFSNMLLPDTDTIAYAAGQDEGSENGSKVHARLQLTNDFYREKTYWDQVSDRESDQGYYLNAVVGLDEESDNGNPRVLDTFQKMLDAYDDANELNNLLGNPKEDPDVTALPRSKIVNAIDVFFQAMLDRKGYVVVMRPDRMPDPSPAYSFLAHERPAGAVGIFFIEGPSHTDGIAIGGGIGISQSVQIEETTLVEGGNTFDLSSNGQNFAIVKGRKILE